MFTKVWGRQARPAGRSRKPYRPALEPLELRLAPATFTVLNTADTGAGSLRQAILDANASANTDSTGDLIPDPDVINFNIPGAGVHPISPTTAFDPIKEAVVIDGYTQPKNDGSGTLATPNSHSLTDPDPSDNAVLLIEISGASLGGATLFQFVGAGGSTVRGLV